MNHAVDRHNALYQRAVKLLRFTTTMVPMVPPVRLSWFQRRRVRRGIQLMERVLQINPENWNALWVMGKAYQAAGESEHALAAFSRSHLIEPDNPDIAREASISAMECSKHDVAIRFAERASSQNEADPGLRANLALAYLYSERPELAKMHIEHAYAKDPNDPITRAVRRVIDDVIAGKRSCPRHSRDV
jgi:Tfp pilus assembly protein PilF